MPLKDLQPDDLNFVNAAELGIEIHTTIDGEIEVLRDNLAPNQYGLEIDDFGDAVGYPIEVPPTPDGRHVFSTELNGGVGDLRRQTHTPHSIEESFLDLAFPFVDSGPQPLRDAMNTDESLRYRPPAPIVESVTVPNKGWPGGNRKLLFTRVNPLGNLHTTPSEETDFHLSEGEGLKVSIPRGPAMGAPASGGRGSAKIMVGIWATDVDGDRSTARLQDIVEHDVGSVILPEYNRGRKLPTGNDTEISPPPDIRRRDINRRSKNGILLAGDYRFVRWYHTAFGITIASRARERFTVNSNRQGEAYFIARPPRRKGAMWWSAAVQYNGQWYVILLSRASGYDAQRIPFDYRRVHVNGTFGTEVEGASGRFGTPRFIYQSISEPPRENTSGIEPLDSAPDVPEGVNLGNIRPTSGTRHYAYADTVTTSSGAQTSLPSPAVKHTTAFGEIARVKFPSRNNLIENAEGKVLRPNGVPVGWILEGSNGGYFYDEANGLHVLTTQGINFTTDTIQIRLQDFEVDTQEAHCFQAFFAAGVTAGTAQIVLQEMDGNGNNVGTITPIQRTTTGADRVVFRCGPGTARPFTAETAFLRPRIRMIGTNRNMTIWFSDLAVHPYIMAPRKVAPREVGAPAEFNASPAMAYPHGVVSAIGPAPATDLEIESPEIATPLYDFDFVNEVTTLPPSGSGWTHQKSAPAVTSVIQSGGWFIQDTTTGHLAFARLMKNISSEIAGDSMATLGVVYITNRMGGASGELDYLRFRRSNGDLHLRFFYDSSNDLLRIRYWNKDGNAKYASTQIKLFTGDTLEYQVIADRCGTNQGRIRVEIGKNGGQRTQRLEINGIDWRNMAWGEIWVGNPAENPNNRTWASLYKRIIVTESGYLGRATEIEVPQAVNAIPDRPTSGPSYRTHTEQEELINQMYLFIPRGLPRFDVPYFARFPVIPGRTYRPGVFGRHEVPQDETGSLPWFFTLHNVETGEVIELGSPYGAGASIGLSAWSQRMINSFTVPSDSTGWREVRASHRNMGSGLFLWQEWAHSQGTTVKRGYALAPGGGAAGTFRVTLDSRTPGGRPINPRRTLSDGRLDLGLRVADQPDDTNVTASFRGASTVAGLASATPQTDPLLVPESTFYRIDGTLSSNPAQRETPYIDEAGPYAVMRPIEPAFLRGNGSELPGGAIIDGIVMPPRRKWFESSTVSGHRYVVDITGDVIWTNPVTIELYTEDAKREVEENWSEEWQARVPYLANGDGLILTLRLEAQDKEGITFVEEPGVGHQFRNGHRFIWARAEGIRAQVIDLEQMGLLA